MLQIATFQSHNSYVTFLNLIKWQLSFLIVTCTYFDKWKHEVSLVTRKPVFGVCDQVRPKPACAATEARQRLEISDVETTGIGLSKKQTTTVWSAHRAKTGFRMTRLRGDTSMARDEYYSADTQSHPPVLGIHLILEFRGLIFLLGPPYVALFDGHDLWFMDIGTSCFFFYLDVRPGRHDFIIFGGVSFPWQCC